MPTFTALLKDVRSCTICKDELPMGPRPVVQLHPKASVLVVGQAPGRKVHESGIPFDDASGNRLRDWMGITSEVFYNPHQIALLPMGFCFPGTGKSGDLPPRSECAPQWRKALLAKLKSIQLTLVIGQYAQAYHLPDYRGTLTELVANWAHYWPTVVPLPHPSPRNNIWLRRNPWFEQELVPKLQTQIVKILGKEN